MKTIIYFSFLVLSMLSCQMSEKTAYQKDLDFINAYHSTIEISTTENPDSRILLVPSYQGRVLTSTSTGISHGWINYDLITSGEILPHMNAFGGEERLWLSPEGGQFSIFFKKDDAFEFENWQTPAAIDSEPFEVVSKSNSEVEFQKEITLKNYSDAKFEIKIVRNVKALELKEIGSLLDIEVPEGIHAVAYQSKNILTNIGTDWQKDSGTLGIWILGMYKSSDKTTLLAPFQANRNLQLTDDYFGPMPSERLMIKDSVLLFKGDGKYRSKIGIAPKSAKPVAGAWDAINNILTITLFDLDPNGDYLKSTWELHDKPYQGDAFNSYNDGPVEDGTQMGPFIELESNSSTKALQNGESITHKQATFHFEGNKAKLSKIALRVLGIDLETVESTMK